MNNQEFDQFLKNEVNSIHYDGGELAWQEFSAIAVDERIKSEVQGIHYDGGEEAWKAFAIEQGIDQSPRKGRVIWRPLAVAASIAILVGVLLHQSATELSDPNPSQLVETYPSLNEDSPSLAIAKTAPTKNNELPHAKTVVPTVPTEQVGIGNVPSSSPSYVHIPSTIAEAQVSKTAPYLHEQAIIENIVSTAKPSMRLEDIAIEESALYSSQSTSELSDRDIIASLDMIPSLEMADLAYPISFTSVEKEIEIQPINKRRFNLFGEIGIGNNQSGLRLLTGVSIPMNSWSVEAGLGLMDKSNRPIYFSHALSSDLFTDFDEYHDYTFIQKVSMIVPVRIKKRIWKRHNILAGLQCSYNFSNQVDIESTVPHVTPQFGGGVNSGIGPDIDYGQEIYKYNNIGSATNAYSVVTSNRVNLEITAGYELDLSRFSLGVSVAKPVFSSFRITEAIDGPVLFNVLENPSVNLSLKYRLI